MSPSPEVRPVMRFRLTSACSGGLRGVAVRLAGRLGDTAGVVRSAGSGARR